MEGPTSSQADERFRPPSLALATAIVAAGFLGSRLLGGLRSVAIAAAFGTSPEPEAAWRLARSVLNLVALATIVLAVLAALLAPLLVPIMAPGLGEDTGRQEELRSLAVDLTRIMMLSPILFAVSGMFMGILNARHHFLWPAIAPMVYHLAIIVGALAYDDVHALAVAVVVGASPVLFVQLPVLLPVGLRWRPEADWRDAAVRE